MPPKNTFVGLAGQNAWHSLRRRGVARGQREIAAVAATHAKGRAGAGDDRPRRRRGLLVQAERVGEETGLCRCGAKLFLETAEKHVEQVFGGRRARGDRDEAREYGDGDQHQAASQALKTQLCTQRLLHRNARKIRRGEAVPRRGNLNAGW